jgi:hypothetical protein
MSFADFVKKAGGGSKGFDTLGGLAPSGMDYLTGQHAKDAAKYAADAAKKEADINSESQMKMFLEGQKATAPWREGGAAGLGMLANIYGVGEGSRDTAMSAFEASPEYQMRMQAQESAMQGGTPEERAELMRRGKGIADRGFTDYARGLQSLAGVGQSMAGQTAQQAYGMGQNVGQGYQDAATSAGEAHAQSVIDRSNMRTNMMDQGMQAYGMWKGRNQQSQGSGWG